MPVHRLSLLVFVFLLPANQMARAQKVTWIDAQNACMRVARCESVHDTVAALCDFADDPLNGAVPTTLPSPDEVRAVLGCKERAGLGAPGSLRIASLSFSAVDQSTRDELQNQDARHRVPARATCRAVAAGRSGRLGPQTA